MWEKLKIELREKIWDSEQILKFRQKFAELDQQTQSYVIIGTFSFFVALLFISFITFWIKTSSLKSDIALLDEKIRYVQSSAAKIEEMKMQSRNKNNDPLLRGLDPAAPISSFAEKIVQKSLIGKASTEWGESSANRIEIKLSKISLKQLMRVLFLIEHSNAKSSVERLSVDSKDDKEGYLWATVVMKKEKGDSE